MNITREEISPVELQLTVKVDQQDYSDEVTKKIKEIGRTHTIPGFRKGHVPFGELKRRFAKGVTSDVLNDMVYRAVFDYIRQNDLNVMGHPVPVEVKEVFTEGDQEFKYDVALLPKLDIKLDKDQTYPYYQIEVTDQMVDEQDQGLRKRFGSQIPGEEMEEDALVKGTLMQLNADGSVNSNEGAIQMTNAIVFPLYFKDKEQAALFEGKKVGDKVVFNPWKAAAGDPAELASMLGIDKAIAADVKDDFEMTISEFVVNKRAELGEEFYKNVFGDDHVKTEEEYRAELKKMIAGELENNSHILFRNTFDKDMMEKYADMPLPEALLTKLFFSEAEEPEKAYQAQLPGIKHEVIEANLTDLLSIQVTDDELLNATKQMTARQFAQYGMVGLDEEIIEKYAKEQLQKREARARIEEQVRAAKLYTAIENAVNLDRKTISLDEFKKVAETL